MKFSTFVSKYGVGLSTISNQYGLEGIALQRQVQCMVKSYPLVYEDIPYNVSLISKLNTLPGCNKHPEPIESNISLFLLYE